MDSYRFLKKIFSLEEAYTKYTLLYIIARQNLPVILNLIFHRTVYSALEKFSK